MKRINNVKIALQIYKEFVESENFKTSISKYLNEANLNEVQNAINGYDLLFSLPNELRSIAEAFSRSQLYQFIILSEEEQKEQYKGDLYERLKNEQANFNKLNKRFKYLYDKLTDKKDGIAYEMIEKLGVRACPYCNLNYIDPVIKTKADSSRENVVRHHFDHFYPRAYFPFLAVSFYNLIPACYECNSGTKHVNYEENLFSPYSIDFDSIAEFFISLTGEGRISSLFDDTNTFDILIKAKNQKDYKEYVKNYVDLFSLEDRYKFRKEEAQEILFLKSLITPEFLKEIKNRLGLHNFSDERLKSIILKNHLKREEINQRPLAKLTQDLIKI